MIVGHEFAQWLGDKDRQNHAYIEGRRFAEQWLRGPVHRRIADAFDGADRGAEAIAKQAARLFADDGWVGKLLTNFAEPLRRNPWFEPHFPAINSDVHNGLIVYENENVTVAAGVTRLDQLAAKKNGPRGAASIGFTGQLTVLKFVRAGGACLSFWEAPFITGDFTAAKAGQCEHRGARRLVDGEILTVDGRCQSYVIEHATSNLVVLQASISADQAPLSVEYDAAGGHYVGCSATEDAASRIQFIASVLRRLEGEDASAAVAAVLDHPSFFVRWHVMRELLCMDADIALPHLCDMAKSDPHPEARRAAAAVLASLETPPPSTEVQQCRA